MYVECRWMCTYICVFVCLCRGEFVYCTSLSVHSVVFLVVIFVRPRLFCVDGLTVRSGLPILNGRGCHRRLANHTLEFIY